ncbi:Uncharacterised protein [Mycolicibacterium phlei]|uniref:Repressor n=1 Tax=Mycolicibacterium phlei DSM 43239 = CCUG 21000 TaxID=1226750 RepID=A0A5N5UVZ2_MYCPH|nr:hypothetical protein [Mycolicibacterium phlei]KXW63986.1 hypothetical protein MPHL43070_23070 [Mycolicibacterium phlei DSM 43070]VEG09795.1 Uncharacterised protein [Mycobacteroides chelonae]AMO61688.1 hypothetical protein MPHLCCUG_02879 [Mycolicibacterium phlei]KAB7753765.1 hypothetical protein MPHL21000_17885 [Mycolicibacterium phlei DSM 43239 = CCUG 21000]KXW63198.1 hypothetical protein MPHL43239_16980 [Mycolicibacterium phlei DSM 43239 = CCUG 21000]
MVSRKPLTAKRIEELRAKGYNQSQIAEMHGVTRQAVSWHKVVYNGFLTTRQLAQRAWPWETTNTHGKSSAYQRLRDHGEFMLSGGFTSMSENKQRLLKSWWRRLRDDDVVLEFDPAIEPYRGMGGGGFRYVPRTAADGDLLIRVNEHTTLTAEGERIWCWPADIESLLGPL